MNSQRVHFVIDLAVQEGKFDDFAATVRSMTAGTAKEAGALEYEWFLSKDDSRCRLLETYANASAAKAHLASTVVNELVPKLLTFATMNSFEVYGDPDEGSAAALSSLGAEIYRHWHGLASQPSGAPVQLPTKSSRIRLLGDHDGSASCEMNPAASPACPDASGELPLPPCQASARRPRIPLSTPTAL